MGQLAEVTVAPELEADVLQSITGERHLLRELRHALAIQRDGVATGEAGSIEIASRAVASAVLTLDNARRRREAMMGILSEGRPVRLDTLERFTGPIEGLAIARAELRHEAEGVIEDLALTQDVLQGALQAGDAWLQSLFGSMADATAGYARQAAPSAPAGGRLLNRRA